MKAMMVKVGKPEQMGKIGKIASALAKASAEGDDEEAASDEYEADEIEVRAMKAFDKATTPEERATALKTFIKACYPGGDE